MVSNDALHAETEKATANMRSDEDESRNELVVSRSTLHAVVKKKKEVSAPHTDGTRSYQMAP